MKHRNYKFSKKAVVGLLSAFFIILVLLMFFSMLFNSQLNMQTFSSDESKKTDSSEPKTIYYIANDMSNIIEYNCSINMRNAFLNSTDYNFKILDSYNYLPNQISNIKYAADSDCFMIIINPIDFIKTKNTLSKIDQRVIILNENPPPDDYSTIYFSDITTADLISQYISQSLKEDALISLIGSSSSEKLYNSIIKKIDEKKQQDSSITFTSSYLANQITTRDMSFLLPVLIESDCVIILDEENAADITNYLNLNHYLGDILVVSSTKALRYELEENNIDALIYRDNDLLIKSLISMVSYIDTNESSYGNRYECYQSLLTNPKKNR